MKELQCNSCIHVEVCTFRENFKCTYEKISESIEESDYIIINMECKHYTAEPGWR